MGNNNVPNRDNWNFSDYKDTIIEDKKRLINSYILYMLNRTQRMFEYKGLPETIPQREIELLLQCNRFFIFTKKDGKYYVFYGGLGGVPDMYYLPTKAIISNPYLKYTKMLDIDKPTLDNDGECIVVWNDTSHIGLFPMFDRYASMIAEVDISIRIASINVRIPSILFADNDTEKESAEEFYKNIVDGKLSVIKSGTSLVPSGTKSSDYTNKGDAHIKDLIELKQYLMANWYNELGLQSNFNMKRESLNTDEVGINEDTLLPLIDDMLECRKKGIAQINEKFGLNITVELSSAWKKVREDIKIQQEQKENEENTPNNEEKKEGEEDVKNED